MRELDDIDLLVICAEAVTEPQGVNLIAAWAKNMVAAGGAAEMFNHPSFQWWCGKHASFISYIAQHDGWAERLR